MKRTYQEVIGVLPAGGRASRVAPLPCSKELFPVGFHAAGTELSLRPKVVSHFLLENMRLANIKKVYIILREGKWDIPAYFGDGKKIDMNLAYLIMGSPLGVPYTINQACPFVQNALVALGFPDIIFEPHDAFVKLLARREELDADIVLGLFPAVKPQKTDMVELDENRRVRSIQVKPVRTQLVYAWAIAIWSPVFTRFMHDFISAGREGSGNNSGMSLSGNHEMHVSDVIQGAIQDGMEVETVIFENGTCLDIGTPEDMLKAVRLLNSQELAE
jgi:glucose-1-phosphate thymidylyltransferase